MISGRETLASIEKALVSERDNALRLDRQNSELTEKKLKLEQEDLEDYRQLARLRVDLINRELVDSKLDRAEQLVAGVLEKRELVIAEIDTALAAVADQLLQKTGEREMQEAAVDTLAEKIDQAEKKTQARLHTDPDYAKQHSQAIEAERIAVHAETKASQSEEELESKGQPYRDDQLFMYLWQKGYGMADYKAGRIVRALDGWVARLIGYSEARANYFRLQEIPGRLRNHADTLRDVAEKEYEILHDMDKKAREEDGITVLDDELEKGRKILEDIDKESESILQRREQLEQRKAEFASGDDEQYRNAVEYMSGELRAKELGHLHLAALSTPYPEDDEVVARLLQRDRDRDELSDTIVEMKELRKRHESRLAELEQVRREFKRQRYDSAGSGFASSEVIGLALNEFLRGMASRDSFWRILEQQRRYQKRQANPRFGSGGFGRGTVWGGGCGMPGGGMRFPNSGRGRRAVRPRPSAGGFRTGGGF
ncbi:hypothetical protein [Desulfosediminicola ganghwensis]|uniref:hypothetical protein n=1 Tax=Desulfosediminicola ganghwensis TaxID=2569540 RepID=UPI0010AD455C|nr:hypothetical protein [Desulfosediminicola ganghwensis]